MRLLVLSFVALLGACTSGMQSEAPTRAAIADTTLPPMKVFATPQPVRPQRSNRDMSRDFLDLAFRMESGRQLDRFTRFEGPITVRVTGRPPATLRADLTRLLHRLRTEAGINISETSNPGANITIEAVSRAKIRQALPQAACFVVPNISSISQYRNARRTSATNWSLLKTRQKMAVFVPNDVSPQEVRDCLHEELAQALGPLNDLYRLPDSIFNDDNIHAVLTGFDMLMLRAYYDPALQSGMTRNEVAKRLPAILARHNPGGEGRGSYRLSPTPASWVDAIQTALGPGTSGPNRRAAASRALLIAKNEGWHDHRLAFSHYANGRLMQSYDSDQAHTHFLLADRYYRQFPFSGPHHGFVATQLAAYAISAGRGTEALALVTPRIDEAAQFENAALLSTLMLLRAEALQLVNRSEEARSVRVDSLGWARYGFGADWAVRAKMREVAALSPLKGGY
ncbi:DUF2927 domain-containing protein [Shimia biformata]|uniref:DUF2927 domain-containing protein n=1 Tax=Shimia biformata TaxID=1294299 RepID=UPI001951D6CF|nr:DUF2927 domain-containing protein [Shimia biformata]